MGFFGSTSVNSGAGGEGADLPVVTSNDEGKVLTVTSLGTWAAIDNDGGLKHIDDGDAAGSIRTSGSTAESGSYHLGNNAFAEGYNTKASGNASHAEGYETQATVQYAHAEGIQTTASSVAAHAEGSDTVASGRMSHAEGTGTIANHLSQHVFGYYNVADDSSANSSYKGNYVEIVGNGTGANDRSNARTLDWSGNEVLSGNLTVSGGSLTLGNTTFTANDLSNGGGGSGGSALPLVTSIDNGKSLIVNNGNWTVDNWLWNERLINDILFEADWTGDYLDNNNLQNVQSALDYIYDNEILSTITVDYDGTTYTLPLQHIYEISGASTTEVSLENFVYDSTKIYQCDYGASIENGDADFSTYPLSVSFGDLVNDPYITVDSETSGEHDIQIIGDPINIITPTADFSTAVTNVFNQISTGNALPAVTAADDTKSLVVRNGNWTVDNIDLGYEITSQNTSLINDDVTTSIWNGNYYVDVTPEISDWSNIASITVTFGNGEPVTLLKDEENNCFGTYGDEDGWVFYDTNYLSVTNPTNFEHLTITVNEKAINIDNDFKQAVNASVDATNTTFDAEVYKVISLKNLVDAEVDVSEGTGIGAVRGILTADDYIMGSGSAAFGIRTEASGYACFAEGHETVANGSGTHAEGYYTIAGSYGTHAEGSGGTFTIDNNTYTSGAFGSFDHSEGYKTRADSGYNNEGSAHSEGSQTRATGVSSHAEGHQTLASSGSTHAEGQETEASGSCAHAEGYRTIAHGNVSHAEGYLTTVNGSYSHAEGYKTTASSTKAHAEGEETTASGTGGHAEGYRTTASNNYSHAEGDTTAARGANSHAEGSNTEATSLATAAHVEGYYTSASDIYAHAEGRNTVASGAQTHAEGYYTTASATSAHAEGDNTVASGYYSHAEGRYTIANHASQHVFGEGNIADTNERANYARGTYVEIVGNGTGSGNNIVRSNARTLDWDGNEVLAGKLTVGANPTNNMDVVTYQCVKPLEVTGTYLNDGVNDPTITLNTTASTLATILNAGIRQIKVTVTRTDTSQLITDKFYIDSMATIDTSYIFSGYMSSYQKYVNFEAASAASYPVLTLNT